MNKENAQSLGEMPRNRPLHEQVAEDILRRIILGEWPEGHVLPSEEKLAEAFGVSYGTVRRAMADLTHQGVVMRRRRTGTVVTGRTPHHTLERFYRYFRLHNRSGDLVRTEAKYIEVAKREASDEEARTLGIEPGEDVSFILRLRVIDGRPVMIDRIVVPLSRYRAFPTTMKETPSLIYRFLLENEGTRLGAVRESVSARLAEPEDCKLLELDPAVPHALLQIDEVAFDPQNVPLLIMRHSALTEHHAYLNEVR
ncbi:GntR family transcriptional regulator [Acuticoccus sediminis]|uniref:GntR family transcriptional regulator n=1 Tax=Acuticoccus sediminis TaxID=2184697 RepID=UPI00299D94F1|nr:GntR family transcriptional regulator [Acuticoccus sediminis]